MRDARLMQPGRRAGLLWAFCLGTLVFEGITDGPSSHWDRITVLSAVVQRQALQCLEGLDGCHLTLGDMGPLGGYRHGPLWLQTVFLVKLLGGSWQVVPWLESALVGVGACLCFGTARRRLTQGVAPLVAAVYAILAAATNSPACNAGLIHLPTAVLTWALVELVAAGRARHALVAAAGLAFYAKVHVLAFAVAPPVLLLLAVASPSPRVALGAAGLFVGALAVDVASFRANLAIVTHNGHAGVVAAAFVGSLAAGFALRGRWRSLGDRARWALLGGGVMFHAAALRFAGSRIHPIENRYFAVYAAATALMVGAGAAALGAATWRRTALRVSLAMGVLVLLCNVSRERDAGWTHRDVDRVTEALRARGVAPGRFFDLRARECYDLSLGRFAVALEPAPAPDRRTVPFLLRVPRPSLPAVPFPGWSTIDLGADRAALLRVAPSALDPDGAEVCVSALGAPDPPGACEALRPSIWRHGVDRTPGAAAAQEAPSVELFPLPPTTRERVGAAAHPFEVRYRIPLRLAPGEGRRFALLGTSHEPAEGPEPVPADFEWRVVAAPGARPASPLPARDVLIFGVPDADDARLVVARTVAPSGRRGDAGILPCLFEASESEAEVIALARRVESLPPDSP